MNKWDALRCKVADFNFQEELYKEEPKIYRDIESTIKENKKFHTLASFATMGVYRPQRAIFTPKEFARQRGSVEGRSFGFNEGNTLLQDCLKYEWSPVMLRDHFAKTISKNLELLETAQKELDDKNTKKIYSEIFLLAKIDQLIYVWSTIFCSDERLMEMLKKEEKYR